MIGDLKNEELKRSTAAGMAAKIVEENTMKKEQSNSDANSDSKKISKSKSGTGLSSLVFKYDNNNNDGLGFISDLRSLANYFPIIPNFSGNSKIYRISTKNEISKYFDSDLSKKSNNLYLAYTEKAYSFKELLNDILGINKPVIRFPFNYERTAEYFATGS